MNPTKESYLSLEEAYFEFNNRLFDGNLPACLITLQRDKKSVGYFHAEIFEGKNGNSGKRTDEIALNPDHFSRDDKQVLSTLAHEMCHLWQHHFGERKSKRTAYHDSECEAKMKEIGLQSKYGNGKETGQKVSHTIIAGGKFDAVCDLLTGKAIHWQSRVAGKPATTPRNGKRVKYTCPICKANAWGKDGLKLLCMECEQEMTPD